MVLNSFAEIRKYAWQAVKNWKLKKWKLKSCAPRMKNSGMAMLASSTYTNARFIKATCVVVSLVLTITSISPNIILMKSARETFWELLATAGLIPVINCTETLIPTSVFDPRAVRPVRRSYICNMQESRQEITTIRDLKPAMKNLNMIFIILDIGNSLLFNDLVILCLWLLVSF